jgi:hypothetical protein
MMLVAGVCRLEQPMKDLFIALAFLAMLVAPALLATRSNEHEKKPL